MKVVLQTQTYFFHSVYGAYTNINTNNDITKITNTTHTLLFTSYLIQ